MPEKPTVGKDVWGRFGPELARKREAHGLNQAQAAQRAGVSPSTWGQVEKGYVRNRGREDDYPPTREFIVKAVKALANWDLADALTLAGFPPERLPIDDEAHAPAKIMQLWNRLSKQQQRALEWTMRLMLDKHAALVDSNVPPRDPTNPVFTPPTETTSRSRA
jgi:transcriptional regulator with XRE-family HTH domain